MKISDVEKVTGLTGKAIRLYEEKGLISVERQENSYRDYNDETILRLKQIKLFRDLGIGINEIILCFNGVVSKEELIEKRKAELESESLENKEKYEQCINLLDEISLNDTIDKRVIVIDESNTVLGIDIGTTTISAVVINIDKNCVIESYTIANNSRVKTDGDLAQYDTEWILEKAKRVVDYLIKAYPSTKSIGVTGQMHGVLYVDKDGNSVSNLYNWQDGRGNRIAESGKTYCEEIKEKTGYNVFTGYGFSTLYYNEQNGLAPRDAYSFCTIMDYVAMKLSGVKLPVIHPTDAASFGLYDIKNNCFDKKAIEKLGLSYLTLPLVALNDENTGSLNGVPVGSAIGDNQASFFGSVKNNDNTMLLNFGTGSQISVVIDSLKDVDKSLEIRPYMFGKYLLCGSALCGGRAYSILEKVFHSYDESIIKNVPRQYEVMNNLALSAYEKKEKLDVCTKFCGMRSQPDIRGSITGIGENNFTPHNLVLGVLDGMASELKEYFLLMNVDTVESVVASGNAVQKNKVLVNLLRDNFEMDVALTGNSEEASIGAALFTALKNNIIDENQISEIIVYK